MHSRYCRLCLGDWYKYFFLMHLHPAAVYSTQLLSRNWPMWRVTYAWSLSESLCMWGGGLPPVPVMVEDAHVCVCAQWGERLLCARFMHHVCSCWSELLTILDRIFVVGYLHTPSLTPYCDSTLLSKVLDHVVLFIFQQPSPDMFCLHCPCQTCADQILEWGTSPHQDGR